MTDTSSDAEVSSVAQYFLVDDFVVWVWCHIVTCSSHKEPDSPPQQKKPRVEEKVETKNETAPKNTSKNASSSSNATAAAGGNGTAGGGEFTPNDDMLK